MGVHQWVGESGNALSQGSVPSLVHPLIHPSLHGDKDGFGEPPQNDLDAPQNDPVDEVDGVDHRSEAIRDSDPKQSMNHESTINL